MVFAPLAGMAQDNVEAEVEVTVLSKYLWRGQQKGGVSLQPGATLSWKGAFVNVEGNKGFNREDEEELDINIGYQFPQQLIKRIRLTSASIALQGSNLFTVSDLVDMDPEQTSRGYPIQRSYGVTLNLGL